MKKTAATIVILLVLATLPACHRRNAAKGNQQSTTETIAPAAPAPAKTDSSATDQMTQTVEVDDSRSEADGGVNVPTTDTAKKTTTPKKKHR